MLRRSTGLASAPFEDVDEVAKGCQHSGRLNYHLTAYNGRCTACIEIFEMSYTEVM